MKKILSLILAVFILLGATIPTANAAKWHVSSLDKTFFEIPPDDRNLRDFVFGNQKISYKKWSDTSDSWESLEATITSNMIWYKTIFNNNPTRGLKVITNEDISSFFVVVDNFYYNTDGKFAFPIYKKYKLEYMYMYWKQDEDQNFCLYLDLENQGTEVYKIKNTCHMHLHSREPFLLFFQVGRTGHDQPNHRGRPDTEWHIPSEDNMASYKISVTIPHKAKYKDKDYITFATPEVFHLNIPSYNSTSLLNPNSLINGFNFPLAEGKNLKNTIANDKFLRQGNQRAFRPYSFYFEQDLLKRYDEIQADETLKAKHCINQYCQMSMPFDYTSYFESFVLSVAAQYYNSPAVTNDNTYIEAPDGIEGGGFQPYNECSGFLDVGCHISNVGISIGNGFKMFLNGIKSFFEAFIKGFFDGIKIIFDEIVKFFDGIKIIFDEIVKFFEGIIDGIYVAFGKEPPKDEEGGFIRDIVNNTIVKWHLVLGTGQGLICDAKFNYSFTDSQKNYIAEEYKKYVPDDSFVYTFFGLFKFINPLPPTHGQEVCTYMGMKSVNYRENSWVDIILVIMFCGMILGLFYRNYN